MSISRLIGIIQEQGEKNNPPYVSIGVVKSVEPFLIQINDLTLDKEDLYVPLDLIEHSINGTFVLNGTLNGNTNSQSCGCTECASSSHSHTLANASYTGTFDIIIKTQFQKNDLVALLPLKNRQKYLLLNKVVGLS